MSKYDEFYKKMHQLNQEERNLIQAKAGIDAKDDLYSRKHKAAKEFLRLLNKDYSEDLKNNATDDFITSDECPVVDYQRLDKHSNSVYYDKLVVRIPGKFTEDGIEDFVILPVKILEENDGYELIETAIKLAFSISDINEAKIDQEEMLQIVNNYLEATELWDLPE